MVRGRTTRSLHVGVQLLRQHLATRSSTTIGRSNLGLLVYVPVSACIEVLPCTVNPLGTNMGTNMGHGEAHVMCLVASLRAKLVGITRVRCRKAMLA